MEWLLKIPLVKLIVIFFFNILFLQVQHVVSVCDNSFPKPKEADLPSLPLSFPLTFNMPSVINNFTLSTRDPSAPPLPEKIIPRNIWIAFKTKPRSLEELGEQHIEFVKAVRASGWNVYMLGHEEQMEFMEKYYANTSTLWAIKMISLSAGASISDMWRVAAVNAFGGLYLDDDSLLNANIESGIEPTDHMVICRERTIYSNTCYYKQYHLSETGMQQKYGSIDFSQLYGGRRFTQWAFFSKRDHPVLKRILTNIVENIRLQYYGRSPVYLLPTEPRWKPVVCTTGPNIWTVTILDMTLAGEDIQARVLNRHDFVEFEGVFKISGKHTELRADSHYYKMNGQYLQSYYPFCVENVEGQPVTDGSKSIFLIDKGMRREFPNWDTFVFYNFTYRDTVFIQNITDFQSIPQGPPLPPCTNC